MPARLLHVFPSEVHARFQRDTVLGRLHVNISPTKSLSFVNVLRAFVAAVECSIGQTVALLIVHPGEILGHTVLSVVNEAKYGVLHSDASSVQST
jgi:hypothetical protein